MPLIATATSFGSYTSPSEPTVPIPVTKITISNTENGFTIEIIDYGAAITALKVPDSRGIVNDVVLGFDNLEGYLGLENENPYFGATIGRSCNRVNKGRFVLDGNEHQLSLNDGENHLHGGFRGFDKRQFKAEIISNSSVTFTHLSLDGDEGYPNNVMAQVTFTITEENEVILDYSAICDGSTVATMTNHSYFNLLGHKTTSLGFHIIEINADNYTPVNSDLIITGEVVPVEGTKFDIRTPKEITQLLAQDPEGYDHNFCLNVGEGQQELHIAAKVTTPTLSLIIETDAPGLQFYTGNFLPVTNPLPGKDGALYYKNAAMCLETQNWPDAVNNANFPSAIVRPGQIYKTKTVWKFQSE